MNVFVNIKLMCVVKEGNFFFLSYVFNFYSFIFFGGGEGVFSYAAMFLFDSFSHFKKTFFFLFIF